MHLDEIQRSCKEILSKVIYPRIGTIIGLQGELGKLSEEIMEIEIYGKSFDKNKVEGKCSELFFSLIDLCNSYDIDLNKISKDRIEEVKRKIAGWEQEHGKTLEYKRKKLD